MAGAKTEGGLWRPANDSDLEDFQRETCAHCLERFGDGEGWEDEFGDYNEPMCALLWGADLKSPIPQWTVKDGKRDCSLFREDPNNPARCLHTMEMFG